MSTIKDIKTIKELTIELKTLRYFYRRDKRKLKQLIQEKKACIDSGYIQHYPEYNSFIGSQLAAVKQSKKQLLKTANKLKEVMYCEV